MPGTLFVVATPIGNLEDISARALRILREVALIAAEDTRRTAHLLARYAIQTPTTSLNAHNEVGKSPALLARLAAGESVALVSDAGTPTVSDPGAHLVRMAIDAGLRVESIPGATAVMALLAVSGLPSETFTFLGFPPTKSGDRKRWFEALAAEPRTVVFFESPHRVRQTLEQMLVIFGDCHIVVGRELTKFHEEVLRCPVSEAMARFADATGEFCIAINLAVQQKKNLTTEVSDSDILEEYRKLRHTGVESRRKTVQAVARKLNVAPNRVYGVVKESKISVD